MPRRGGLFADLTQVHFLERHPPVLGVILVMPLEGHYPVLYLFDQSHNTGTDGVLIISYHQVRQVRVMDGVEIPKGGSDCSLTSAAGIGDKAFEARVDLN